MPWSMWNTRTSPASAEALSITEASRGSSQILVRCGRPSPLATSVATATTGAPSGLETASSTGAARRQLLGGAGTGGRRQSRQDPTLRNARAPAWPRAIVPHQCGTGDRDRDNQHRQQQSDPFVDPQPKGPQRALRRLRHFGPLVCSPAARSHLLRIASHYRNGKMIRICRFLLRITRNSIDGC